MEAKTKKDIDFLKEMKERHSKCQKDAVEYEYLGNMIDDWIDELSKKSTVNVVEPYNLDNLFGSDELETTQKNRLLDVAKELWELGLKLKAIKIIAIITRLGMKEAKWYCENNFDN